MAQNRKIFISFLVNDLCWRVLVLAIAPTSLKLVAYHKSHQTETLKNKILIWLDFDPAWRCSGVLIVNFCAYFTPFSIVSIVDFEQVNVSQDSWTWVWVWFLSNSNFVTFLSIMILIKGALIITSPVNVKRKIL